MKRACKIHPITALQTEYSLWARDVEDAILPACRELGIGFVAYSPLGRGLLTGTVRKIEDIAPHDHRRKQPRFRAGNFQKNLELIKPLEHIAAKRGVAPAQVALAWLLSRGEDVVPIPGNEADEMARAERRRGRSCPRPGRNRDALRRVQARREGGRALRPGIFRHAWSVRDHPAGFAGTPPQERRGLATKAKVFIPSFPRRGGAKRRGGWKLE